MTSLLNGQAVKVGFCSTSVTARRGSRRFSARGAGGAGKAAADHDDPAGGTLRQRRAKRQRRAGGERRPLQEVASRGSPARHLRRSLSLVCAAYHAAMAALSGSEKPLAMRSITVAGRCPARKACIAATISAAGRPTRRGTGVCTAALAAWQPEQELAPGGASAAAATAPRPDTKRPATRARPILRSICAGTRIPALNRRRARCASPARQADLRSWFISGSERIRLPVAAKIALSTAGAATEIVGSPTPPQKSPVGTMTTSTFGISSMRITL